MKAVRPRFALAPALVAWLVSLAASMAAAQTPAGPPAFARDLPPIRSGDPVFAFNGKDLSGFYVYMKPHGYADPNEVVTVADGAIRVSGQDFGGFATGGSFSDYHLVVEWRWGERTWPPRVDRARDSGVLLHCVGPDGAYDGMWMESVEAQIIEGGSGDILMVGGREKPRLTVPVREGAGGEVYYDPAGTPLEKDSGRFNWWGRDPAWTDTLGVRGPRDVEAPLGEWNRFDIVCDGDRVEIRLNGVLVNAGSGSSHTEGKLQFQSEGAEIHFRRIEVRPLLR
jgi:hypothetical protein